MIANQRTQMGKTVASRFGSVAWRVDGGNSRRRAGEISKMGLILCSRLDQCSRYFRFNMCGDTVARNRTLQITQTSVIGHDRHRWRTRNTGVTNIAK